MKIPNIQGSPTGLYVLGALYPDVTGGMEIFNYYFLNYQLNEPGNNIYYLGEKGTENKNGHFVVIKKRWPVRFFYPFQFFFIILKMRKFVHFAYLSYAEQSWIITYSQSLVLRFFKIPYIITIHWGKEPDWKFSFPYISYFRNAFAVIGVSEPVCSAFKKVIPDREFIYIPPLIPFKRSTVGKFGLKRRLGFLDDQKIILYVGSLKAMKNPDKIIEAFAKLGPEYLEAQNIRLVMAGKGEMEEELRNLITTRQMNKYIRLEGLVNREHMPDYYMSADAYIIASDYEGTSLSLLEAMYNKLIIIGSNAPGINKMLSDGENALLYETRNTTQLSECIKRIFSEPDLSNNLAEKAFMDFNERYSYISMIKKYQTIFSLASL